MALIYVYQYARRLLLTVATVFLITNMLLITDRAILNTYSVVSRTNPCTRKAMLSTVTTNIHNDRKTYDATANLAAHKRKILGGNGSYVKEDKAASIEHMKDDRIDAMIAKLKATGVHPIFPRYFWNSSLAELTKRLGAIARKTGNTLEGYKDLKIKANMSNWQLVHRDIRQFALYNPENPAVDGLLRDIARKEITEIDDNEGGTQFKLNLNFDDGGRAVFKPMRYPREVGANPNHYIFDDVERHVAEIAAFHLDRLLGFYRVPPTVGRIVNITKEIKPLVSKNVSETFFISPAGNVCFYGICDYYCNSAHAFCGNPDMIEGSVMSYLPSRSIVSRDSFYQPWRRSYREDEKAVWETNNTFCETVRHKPPFNNGKMLLDMIDAHTFDFLTGNKDRHSFATFEEFENYTFPIMFDNGRGFGRQEYDAMSILAPLRQCCMIRKSTFLKYVRLYIGPHKMSYLMLKSLADDPVSPVLLPGHLHALDRRVKKILLAVAKCLETGMPVTKVIISDRF